MPVTRHDLELRVSIDEERLAAYNRDEATTRNPILIPADPSEWDADDLRRALSFNTGTSAEVRDYSTVPR